MDKSNHIIEDFYYNDLVWVFKWLYSIELVWEIIYYLEIKVCIEHPWAIRASKSLHTSMNFDMLVEICSLSEAKTTIIKRALVGSFISMNP